jgi:hypothetical protein
VTGGPDGSVAELRAALRRLAVRERGGRVKSGEDLIGTNDL